ncbi:MULTISPECIES: hypothetical protein [Shewanella]|uniref:hypothetical protein n=1 Tax=Shewanella TaxID=22 RepID=UPI001BC64D88|nr:MULTISPECIES: hypothetical protein [Shewanella]GIU49854.1 hypothetical protein TUM4249_08620 [Shewanella sp. KT0246]
MGQYFSGLTQYTCITAVLLYGLGWYEGEKIADGLSIDDTNYSLAQESLARKIPFYELGISAGYDRQQRLNTSLPTQ